MKKHLLTPGSPREQRLDAWWLWRGIYFPIYFLDLSCATIPLCFFIELHLQVSWEGCKSMLNFYYNRQQHTNTSIRWKLSTQEKKRSRNIHRGKSSREKKIKKQKLLPKKHCLKYQLLRHGHYAACRVWNDLPKEWEREFNTVRGLIVNTIQISELNGWKIQKELKYIHKILEL